MPYIYAHPLSSTERDVINAGYPWVSTVVLDPHTPDSLFDQSCVDRLNPHGHGSPNTHVVVSGELIISRAPGHIRDPNNLRISTSANNRWQEVRVDPGVIYQGWAGPDGCVFVEAHASLSPTTALRFESRGDLMWVDNDGNRVTTRAQLRNRDIHQEQLDFCRDDRIIRSATYHLLRPVREYRRRRLTLRSPANSIDSDGSSSDSDLLGGSNSSISSGHGSDSSTGYDSDLSGGNSSSILDHSDDGSHRVRRVHFANF